MKQFKLAFLSLFLLSFAGLKAQQNHFIYIQTENKQPFYVKHEKKLYSSSTSGYIILAKLKAGVFNLAVGFPKTEWPEQNLVFSIDQNDAGFILKNFGDKGWGLFDLQTLKVTMSEQREKLKPIEVVNNDDAFSNMLSTVVNDSTIRQTETVKLETVKASEKEAELVKTPEKEMVVEQSAANEPATAVTMTQKEATTGKSEMSLEEAKEILKNTDKESGIVAVKENTADKIVVPVKQADSQTVKPEMTLEEAKEILKNSQVKNLYTNVDKTADGKATVVTNNTVASTGITRSLLNTNKAGTEMIFIDVTDGQRDTITVFIPADKKESLAAESKRDVASNIEQPKTAIPENPTLNNQSIQPEKKVESSLSKGTAPTIENSGKTTDARFLDITVPAPNQQSIENKTAGKKVVTEILPGNSTKSPSGVKEASREINDPSSETVVQKSPMINSDCKNFATDDDFLKLRRKMVTADNDDEMILLAKKLFKTKCFTVEQLKNLSVLFLKDAGKYAFFDMAYPFSADSHNFGILQNQLSDTYYISRFQAMIRH